MNKDQEDLIATGLWLLISSSGRLESHEKKTWKDAYDKLFGEDTEENKSKGWEKHLP